MTQFGTVTVGSLSEALSLPTIRLFCVKAFSVRLVYELNLLERCVYCQKRLQSGKAISSIQHNQGTPSNQQRSCKGAAKLRATSDIRHRWTISAQCQVDTRPTSFAAHRSCMFPKRLIRTFNAVKSADVLDIPGRLAQIRMDIARPARAPCAGLTLSLIHISEPTRPY